MKSTLKRLKAPEYNLSSPLIAPETRWRTWDAIDALPYRGSIGTADYDARMLRLSMR
jgi:hypothetical protein